MISGKQDLMHAQSSLAPISKAARSKLTAQQVVANIPMRVDKCTNLFLAVVLAQVCHGTVLNFLDLGGNFVDPSR